MYIEQAGTFDVDPLLLAAFQHERAEVKTHVALMYELWARVTSSDVEVKRRVNIVRAIEDALASAQVCSSSTSN